MERGLFTNIHSSLLVYISTNGIHTLVQYSSYLSKSMQTIKIEGKKVFTNVKRNGEHTLKHPYEYSSK